MIIAQRVSKIVKTPDHTLTILQNLSFSIQKSESVAIIGASGSGKSTLLGLLAGLDSVSQGKIIIADQAIHLLDEDQRAQLRAEKIGFIFQSFQLLSTLTALENVMLPLELFAKENAKEKAIALLDSVGLFHRLGHYPKQLSGGEQQRVAIARAFANDPKILFADEPTGNLDNATGEKIIQLLFTLNTQHHTTLVLVTHDNNLAKRCQRCLLLHNGQIQELDQTNQRC